MRLRIRLNKFGPCGQLDAQNDFLDHAAHELKTLLAVMVGETQRLRRAPRKTENYESNLLDMEQEFLRLAKVVDSLLMLAKARAGTRDISGWQL